MSRNIVIAHVHSLDEASGVMRVICALPGVSQVELSGLEINQIRFEVVYDDGPMPLDDRLRDNRTLGWRVVSNRFETDVIDVWIPGPDSLDRRLA